MARKENRVDELITAGVEEFLKKGYDGATMESIAKRAGVSKGGLYHYFPNKEVLLMEANKKISEPVMKMAEKVYFEKSILMGLRGYIKNYLKYWVTHPRESSFLFLSMSKAFESPILSGYYEEYVNESIRFFTDIFQKANELKEAKVEDPKAHGIALMGALDGVLSYLMIQKEENIDVLIERLERIWIPEV